jgi:C4-dicarboxylate-binding protein DctP
MRASSALALAGLLVVTPAALVAAPAPIVIKFSHVVAPETPKGQAALRFKELAEEATHGRVRVDVYPNSTLYKDKEELEALQLGNVQMLAPSLAKFAPLGVTEFELFDLPFIFDTEQELHRITQGPVGRKLLRLLEPKGIIGLAYWDNGFKVMSANRPLRKPADFEGLKIRIQSSRVLESQMRAMGAHPQVMAFSEVYKALQAGVVDGTENPPSNLYTQKMHEVQKYVTVSNHGYLGYAVIVNRRFWTALPPDIRDQLDAAINGATRYANAIAQMDNERALEAVKASGKCQVIELTIPERAAWKKVMNKAHEEHASRIGADLVAEVYAETGYAAK